MRSEPVRPRTGENGAHVSSCRLCEALCGLVVEVEDGRIARIGPDRDHPVSEGHMCIKGARMLDVVHDSDRVLTPLRRTAAGRFEPVGWDEALDDIAARLSAIVARHGGTSVGHYLGNPASFGTMHPAYAAGFLRALGGTKKFNALHTDTCAKNLAVELTYGSPYRYTFPDLEDCDFLIVIGGNPAVSHMSLICEPRVLSRLDAIAARGGVVVVDPRRTETARRYEHLPVLPDGDIWLLVLMLRAVFSDGLFDPDALDRVAHGWRALQKAVAAIDPAEASRRCGVPVAAAEALARRFAAAPSAACYTRLGTGRGSFSTLTNLLIEALNIVTGRLGQRGGWVIGQGPVEALKGNPTPYGASASRIGGLPLVLGITPGGSLADEILTPGEGQLRALFVDAGNPVLSYPRGDRLDTALGELELMVSLDMYVTETTRRSHYILPATSFLERADLNELWGANASRPWVQYSDAVLLPQGEARNEYDVYRAILARMGLPSPLAMMGSDECPDPDPIEAADLLLRAGPWGDRHDPAGLSVARLRTDHPHGFRYVDRVDAAATGERIHFEDRKARLWGGVHAAEFTRLSGHVERTHAEGRGLRLFGRRRLQSLNSWMHNSERLTRGHVPTLQIHPDDATHAGIRDGQMVRVRSAQNALTLVAEVTADVIPGAVCYPHGWGHRGGWQRANAMAGGNVNLLASDDPAEWEQVSGICLLDGIPVDVTPADEEGGTLPMDIAAAAPGG